MNTTHEWCVSSAGNTTWEARAFLETAASSIVDVEVSRGVNSDVLVKRNEALKRGPFKVLRCGSIIRRDV